MKIEVCYVLLAGWRKYAPNMSQDNVIAANNCYKRVAQHLGLKKPWEGRLI